MIKTFTLVTHLNTLLPLAKWFFPSSSRPWPLSCVICRLYFRHGYSWDGKSEFQSPRSAGYPWTPVWCILLQFGPEALPDFDRLAPGVAFSRETLWLKLLVLSLPLLCRHLFPRTWLRWVDEPVKLWSSSGREHHKCQLTIIIRPTNDQEWINGVEQTWVKTLLPQQQPSQGFGGEEKEPSQRRGCRGWRGRAVSEEGVKRKSESILFTLQ